MPSPTPPTEEDHQPHAESPDNEISQLSNQISRSSASTKSSSEGDQSTHTPEAQASTLDLDNPFEKDNDKELADRVRTFTDTDEGLDQHFELLNRGAQLAKDKNNALDNRSLFPDLLEEQKSYLMGGKGTGESLGEVDAGFWGQSKYLKGSVLSACMAGIIQGWTQSAMNGANLGIAAEFNLPYRVPKGSTEARGLWVLGILNAVPFLAGGLLAPLVSDPLQEHFLGRRGAIAVACILTIAATTGQCFSTSLAQIIGCRIITGVTLAAKASSAPLLTAEVAPNHLRGKLLSTWQLSDAFGIFLGFSANLATLHIDTPDTIRWRIQIATILIPAIILLFLVYFMPESPRYLMKRGRPVKALDAFTLLRPSPVARLLAARDLVYAHFQLQMECESIEKRRQLRLARKRNAEQTSPPGVAEEAEGERGKEKQNVLEIEDRQGNASQREAKATFGNGQGNGPDLESQGPAERVTPLYVTSDSRTPVSLDFFRRIKQTFTDARARRALVCALTAMVSQQLTGINTIVFLSTTLLSSINTSEKTGAWVGFGIGICNFVFGAPSFWLLDSVGRATMLLIGFVPMFGLMLALAFSFKEGLDNSVSLPLIGVFGILYLAAYSPTAGTSPFAISAEVFPLVVREVGHSLAVAVNFLSLGVVLLFFPPLSTAMGGSRASLSLFGGLNLLAFVLCFLFVPETKGRSLEELRSIFDIPTREHIRYRLKYVAPWLWRRFMRLLVAWVPKPKGNSNGNTQGASVDVDFVGFRDWYAGELLRRDIEARAAEARAAEGTSA